MFGFLLVVSRCQQMVSFCHLHCEVNLPTLVQNLCSMQVSQEMASPQKDLRNPADVLEEEAVPAQTCRPHSRLADEVALPSCLLLAPAVPAETPEIVPSSSVK